MIFTLLVVALVLMQHVKADKDPGCVVKEYGKKLKCMNGETVYGYLHYLTPYEGTIEIYMFQTYTNYLRRGVGTALMKYFINHIAPGCQEIRVSVTYGRGNRTAEAFYKTFDFDWDDYKPDVMVRKL
ncbi:acetyltransferase (GNAT) family domain-containing protein [Ditylenchus destructor]|uniref:Acetyltransferase (GNAT) family domain-containing protein n=1 Tax=Ditylenchus destructor TaxID=166010 RepID=A0AAD4MJ68_9BILA|nr:acetyltransferase (GNAT) family domain-containing protein [Ditylenchus destructor]